MKILALEFSSEMRSVALVDSGRVAGSAGPVTKSLESVAQASAPASSRTVPVRESESRDSRLKESGSGTLPELAAGTAALRRPATLPLAVAGRAAETGGRHTRAFALIDAALRDAGWERETIECIAVGLGPGSYSGIRAAIALAQGWQFSRRVQVLGVGSAECLAAQAHNEGARGAVHFLIDAQRGEFYCARAELAEAAPRVEALRIIGLDEARSLPAGTLFVEPALLPLFPNAHALCPDAAALGILASARGDFASAEKLEPVYLRPTCFVKAPPPRVIPPLQP